MTKKPVRLNPGLLLLLSLFHYFLGRGDAFLPARLSFRSTTTALGARNLGGARTQYPYPPPPQKIEEENWFPRAPSSIQIKEVPDDDIFGANPADEDIEDDDEYDAIETKGVQLMARLLSQRLGDLKAQLEEQQADNPALNSLENTIDNKELPTSGIALRNYKLAKGRFMDLTCTVQGEVLLESLFLMGDAAREKDPRVVQAAVMALQSILVLGTQVGVKGSPVQLQRMIAHLDSRGSIQEFKLRDLEEKWDTDSVRRLKYSLVKHPGNQVLAQMQWKRSTLGAYELLVALGVWGKHEDLPLLRSGFSVRFNQEEEEAAEVASRTTRDVDEKLGLRKDLRHLKVFTIDSADTSEIDDGISLEKFTDDTGKERQRIWIHIADAERWAPRSSELFDIARRRVTSLYLPQGPIPMLPSKASDDIMSLVANRDSFALSLGVELNEDGSIDDQSITVTPSLIRVLYRLTYDEVDEMLEEGIGYSEEWELGALLESATLRRNFRISQGSSEGLVPNPIPQKAISISNDDTARDGIRIDVTVQATHNAGSNQTATAETSTTTATPHNVEPVSEAFTLVTETMIMAGEAMGRWGVLQNKKWGEKEESTGFYNQVRMPYRTQRKPDYTSRARERAVMNNLAEYNVGGGYCYSWFCRRFLSPVKVMEDCAPHSGLGLTTYVQWTSPIRRYSDLMVHNSVKRYLRRQRIIELLSKGQSIESLDLTSEDIGCPLPGAVLDVQEEWGRESMDDDIDFAEGGGLMGAARMLQRQSEQYWLFEYIRRIHDEDPNKVWEALVLGYIGGPNKSKRQYAIYIYELGFEYRMSSPFDLSSGVLVKLQVSQLNPRAGQLGFVRVNG